MISICHIFGRHWHIVVSNRYGQHVLNYCQHVLTFPSTDIRGILLPSILQWNHLELSRVNKRGDILPAKFNQDCPLVNTIFVGEFPPDALPNARRNQERIAIMYLLVNFQFLLETDSLTSPDQADFIQKLSHGILQWKYLCNDLRVMKLPQVQFPHLHERV